MSLGISSPYETTMAVLIDSFMRESRDKSLLKWLSTKNHVLSSLCRLQNVSFKTVAATLDDTKRPHAFLSVLWPQEGPRFEFKLVYRT